MSVLFSPKGLSCATVAMHLVAESIFLVRRAPKPAFVAASVRMHSHLPRRECLVRRPVRASHSVRYHLPGVVHRTWSTWLNLFLVVSCVVHWRRVVRLRNLRVIHLTLARCGLAPQILMMGMLLRLMRLVWLLRRELMLALRIGFTAIHRSLRRPGILVLEHFARRVASSRLVIRRGVLLSRLVSRRRVVRLRLLRLFRLTVPLVVPGLKMKVSQVLLGVIRHVAKLARAYRGFVAVEFLRCKGALWVSLHGTASPLLAKLFGSVYLLLSLCCPVSGRVSVALRKFTCVAHFPLSQIRRLLERCLPACLLHLCPRSRGPMVRYFLSYTKSNLPTARCKPGLQRAPPT
mmetsp:Transcript_4391/g.8308  ORF Transcript_4391/g.8308 Transcript_4391/m.8308 type:complete len:347 (-) Transcript_4391:400-1440(-)